MPQFQVPASEIKINHNHVTDHTQFKCIYWLQKPKTLTQIQWFIVYFLWSHDLCSIYV